MPQAHGVEITTLFRQVRFAYHALHVIYPTEREFRVGQVRRKPHLTIQVNLPGRGFLNIFRNPAPSVPRHWQIKGKSP